MSNLPIGAEFEDSAPFNEEEITIKGLLEARVTIVANAKRSSNKEEVSEEIVIAVMNRLENYLDKFEDPEYQVSITIIK